MMSDLASLLNPAQQAVAGSVAASGAMIAPAAGRAAPSALGNFADQLAPATTFQAALASQADVVASASPAAPVVSPPLAMAPKPAVTAARTVVFDGKLPDPGNLLPVIPVLPGLAPHPDLDGDNSADDKSNSPVSAPDAAAQPLLALVSAAVPPVPLPAPTTRISPAAPSATSPLPAVASGTLAGKASPAPAGPGVAVQAPASMAGVAAQVPAPVAGATELSLILPAAQRPETPPLQSATASTDMAAVTLPPLAGALIAPAAVNTASSGLSTASRLARQSGAPQDADADAPAGDSPGLPSPPTGALPAAFDPASSTNPAAPVTSPQDFAALVDRLLEARASAQGSATPQQIGTSVTHADFGKVSLSFRQDGAGLSVRMTSEDPGFAPAAQAAIAHLDVAAAQSGSGTAAHLSAGDSGQPGPGGNQPGSTSQGLAQPNAPAATDRGTGGQGAAGFSAAGGGSQQSPAQPQPQQRPGSIAAASRAPTGSGQTGGDAAAASPGIFA